LTAQRGGTDGQGGHHVKEKGMLGVEKQRGGQKWVKAEKGKKSQKGKKKGPPKPDQTNEGR